MAIETVRVDILGTSFTIQTDETKDYIESLLTYFQNKITMIHSSSRVSDPLKASILASIYIIDELFRERVDASLCKDVDSGLKDELSSITDRLIARIDDTLRDSNTSMGRPL